MKSTQDKKMLIFITGYERPEEKLHCKAFQQTQASPPTEHAFVFLKRERFLLGLDGELSEQPLVCSVPHKMNR